MALEAGARLGPYEVVAPLGAGGMGVVYRARDTRLARDVALKVIADALAQDADRVRRFEREARAAGALNHPNVLTIYDVGSHDGAPFLVSELLEGESLRSRLNSGALPPRIAAEYAAQVARGLSAAHAKGIVHRDLKPENVFVARNGLVKVLDFGIAKLTEPLEAGGVTGGTTIEATARGAMMGTAAYMAPEQVNGESVDHRTDLFALGIVLHEMLTGSQAFARDTPISTLHAIVSEDTPPLEGTPQPVPAGLERIVRRCLAKKPADRFQSAEDLAFSLQSLVDAQAPVSAPRRPRSRGRFVALPAAMIALGAAGGLMVAGLLPSAPASGTSRADDSPDPRFERLTFRGYVTEARFSPDGETVVYSAASESGPLQTFTTRLGSVASSPLDVGESQLLSVTSNGDVILLLRPGFPLFYAMGVLATRALAGGAPRELIDGAVSADGRDGQALAVSRAGPQGFQLEFPVGNRIYSSASRLDSVRVSRSGDRVAFSEGDVDVRIADRTGSVTTVSTAWESRPEIAWAPDDREIWFSAARSGGWRATLQAVSPTGVSRPLLALASHINLFDVDADGRLLLGIGTSSKGMLVKTPDSASERDLSWLDWAHVADISRDGRLILFTEVGEGARNRRTEGSPETSQSVQRAYLRPTDGSPAVDLAPGRALRLSPDTRWALTVSDGGLWLVPTGAGQARLLVERGVERADWLPDGNRIVFVADEAGARSIYTSGFAAAPRTFVLDLRDVTTRPLGEPGLRGLLVSPDGAYVLADVPGAASGPEVSPYVLVPLDAGPSVPVEHLRVDDEVLQWSDDGRWLFARRRERTRFEVFRVRMEDGRRETLFNLEPDAVGSSAALPMVITPDGSAYAYTYARHRNDLYLVTGIQ